MNSFPTFHSIDRFTFDDMEPTAIVSVEGVNLRDLYVPREISIYYVATKTTVHHHFDPPINFRLDKANQKTDGYVRNVLGGIGIFTVIPGAKPQSEATSVVTSLGGYRIMCAGNTTSKWLRTILPYGTIIDVHEVSNFVYPKELIPAWCGYLHKNSRYCSLTKMWTLVHYLRYNGEI